MIKVIISEAKIDDCNFIVQIEKTIFNDCISEEKIIKAIDDENLQYYVATYEGLRIGYGAVCILYDESHILNVAVKDEFRGKGIGEKIVRKLIKWSEKKGIKEVTLEVRESNLKARNLYGKLNFIEEGIRKKYYIDNGENAVIMWYRKDYLEI